VHEKIAVDDGPIGEIKGHPLKVAAGRESDNEFEQHKQVLVGDVRLMEVTVASGRADVYNYIELYNIMPRVKVGEEVVYYYGSPLEEAVLAFFAPRLGPADLLHVEYTKDKETREELLARVPPPLSRLGFKMFSLGLTWFKDWYIAEGWKEGPIKLTGERPLDAEMVRRNAGDIKAAVEAYLEKTADENLRRRAQQVLRKAAEFSKNPSAILD
jgi:hypothetical protein